MLKTIEGRAKAWMLALTPLLLAASMAGCDEPVAAEVSDPASLAAADQAQGLSGTWVLNLEESDLPERDGSGFGPGGPPDGDGPPRGRRGPRSRQGEDGPGGPPPGVGRRGPRFGGELEIAEGDGTVTITRNGRRSVTFYTDGRTETHETPRGHQVELSASFEDGALVIRHSVEDRASAVRSFSLSQDGQQLFVEHLVEHPERGSREFTLVYDRS